MLVQEGWSLELDYGGAFSIDLIRGLKERTPALHAKLRKLSRSRSRITACAYRFAVLLGPHCPIAPADADAEIIGDEVGQHAFDLYTPRLRSRVDQKR